jgi:hypothetical protein
LGLNNENLCLFISNLDIFPLISPRENQYQQYQCTFSDTVNYRSVWYQTGYDLTVKNNNISPRENQYQQYQCTFSDTGKISPRENQYQQYQCTFSDTGKISPRENQYQQYQCTFSDTVNYLSVWHQTRYR